MKKARKSHGHGRIWPEKIPTALYEAGEKDVTSCRLDEARPCLARIGVALLDHESVSERRKYSHQNFLPETHTPAEAKATTHQR